jgi:Uncharacterized conserved protein
MKLSEMTLEELWRLFPIFLVPHNEKWGEFFLEEKALLSRYLNPVCVKRIEHFGSTAVPDIYAKNIIDILIEAYDLCDASELVPSVEEAGYSLMNKERLSFRKGYTQEGFADKVFHLHLRNEGDVDELYFRDYLIAHSDVAKEYEKLKIGLWKKFEHDRDGYTDAKGEFIKIATVKAKTEFGGRYN